MYRAPFPPLWAGGGDPGPRPVATTGEKIMGPHRTTNPQPRPQATSKMAATHSPACTEETASCYATTANPRWALNTCRGQPGRREHKYSPHRHQPD
ncbi:Hypothetical predicted protein [Pelobates cultripes]|uniref:Uncharacterized protein n=1 Tax=Pelobates cultripes TaxID=61616 RepID=A0AAD1W7F9_PELCU|nr:Hypothetical predicted protein [Pelobates cultripes]